MTELVTFVDGKKRRSRVEVFALGPNNTILMASKGAEELPFFPGGGIDENESVVQSGMRELAEEAGWLAENEKELVMHGNWIFNGPTDEWFQKAGWQEESNYAVICNAIKFEPTEVFGSEGDGDVTFALLPMSQAFSETENSLDCLNPRLRFMATFRLAVLEQLMNTDIKKYQTESFKYKVPTWLKW